MSATSVATSPAVAAVEELQQADVRPKIMLLGDITVAAVVL